MMRTLKVAFVGLILAAALMPYAVGAAESNGRAPATDVNVAHVLFQPPGGEPDHEGAENLLRYFALQEPDSSVDLNLAWVERSNWQTGFKTLFARAVGWARRTQVQNPDELYRLWREFSARPKAGERHWESVAVRLLALAAHRGHAAAKRDYEEWSRKATKKQWAADHAWLIKRVERGEAWAMSSLAVRYKLPRGPERNLAKAYYWFLRARTVTRGEDSEKAAHALAGVERRISPEEMWQALKWLEEGTAPPP